MSSARSCTVVGAVAIAAVACAKPATRIVGDAVAVVVPSGWQIAPDDAPAMFLAIRDPRDERRGVRPWVLATVDRPRALPAIAIYEIAAAARPPPAPGARAVVEGATVERCRTTAETFRIPAGVVYVLDRGADAGCDLRSTDGHMRSAVFAIGSTTVIVSCKREGDDEALDRACEQVVQTVRAK